ncbi:MAG: pentapeptide repeat-containing protein [Phycisphaerales bacterium]|nr:MAG: pentapeptide repeat-containing protein [Phycisphaerales bacterium]
MGRVPPNSLEEVRVDAEISDDPAALKEIADAVVRGCSIRYARIKSLRGLINAVQAHSHAKLAPPAAERGKSWKPPNKDSPDALTHLAIYGGEIDDDGDYQRLDIRFTLTLRIRFAGIARFDRTHFGEDAGFDKTRFCGHAGFSGARFDGEARFEGAQFDGNAGFDKARFYMDARFGGPSFGGASFGGYAGFGGASFGGNAGFIGSRFAGNADFGGVSFGGNVNFSEAIYGELTMFTGACFVGVALFGKAKLEAACFSRAIAPRAIFTLAKLAKADFSDADLTGASLNSADLSGANLTGASLFRADVSQMDITGARLIRARGLFGKGRAIARTKPIGEHAAQTAIYGWKYDLATWERLRIIGSLRLFGVSYLTVIAIVLYATFAKWYNAFAADARESAEAARDMIDGVGESFPIWVTVLSQLQDLPLPTHLGWQLLATLTVAAAATIYAICCPSEVQEQTEVRWTRAMNQPLWEYRAANWSRWWARYLCLVLFLAGGAYSAYYIVWRTMIAIGYLFSGSA